MSHHQNTLYGIENRLLEGLNIHVTAETPTEAYFVQVPLIHREVDGSTALVFMASAYRTSLETALAPIPDGAARNVSAQSGKPFEIQIPGQRSVYANVLRVRRAAELILLIGATGDDGAISLSDFLTQKPGDTDPALHPVSHTPLENRSRTAPLSPQALGIEVALIAAIAEGMAKEDASLGAIARTIARIKRKRKQSPNLDAAVQLTEIGEDIHRGDATRFIVDGMKLNPGDEASANYQKAAQQLCTKFAKSVGPLRDWARKLLADYPMQTTEGMQHATGTVSGKAPPTLTQALRLLRCEKDPNAKTQFTDGNMVDRGMRAMEQILQTKGAERIIVGDAREFDALTQVAEIMAAALAPGNDKHRKVGGAAVLSAKSGQRGSRGTMEGFLTKVKELQVRAQKLKDKEAAS